MRILLVEDEAELADQGEGIPAEDRERIFEPFCRLGTLPAGTGLGLHLVREILRRYGARVSVHDEPRGGACFRVDFPSIPIDR